MLCTPESKWPCDRLHSINARILSLAKIQNAFEMNNMWRAL